MLRATGSRSGRRTVIRGRIFSDGEWIDGRLTLSGVRIQSVDGKPIPTTAIPDAPLLIPGFVDLHVHGGAGHDIMGGESDVRGMARFHAEHGTAALLPTTTTAKPDDIAAALAGIAAVRSRPEPRGALVMGAHLEGPFINPKRLGAQPPFTIAPDADLVRFWVGICPILVATVAPELEGANAVVALLDGAGCRVQIGHSDATCDIAENALAGGVSGFTHLFNAMSGMDHRAPGVSAAALSAGQSAEMIADLHHVAAPMIRLAARAIPGLHAVTDATAAAGMPDGDFRLGASEVMKTGARVTLKNGATLAGSALTMDRALRNLVEIGLPLEVAVAMVSSRPARYLGRDDIGRLVPGARASLVQLDSALSPERIWVEGHAI